MAFKSVRMPFGRSLEHKPEHPERTARRSVGRGLEHDIEFKTWNAREPMARAIRAQQRREPHSGDWRAVVPLRDGEGY